MFSSPMAFYYTLAKNYLVIDIGTEAAKHAGLDAVLAAVAGKDIRSLATNPNFADAMKSLSSHSQGVMNKIGEPADACSTASADAALYLNIQPFMQMLYKQTEEGIVRAEDVVSALGFAELKSICATMHMREKYNLSQAMVYMPGDKSGLAKLLAKPLAETTPPSFVPANVVSYGAVSFDMSDFFKQLLSLVEQINPGIHAQVVGQLQMLAANEAEPFDIEKELFGSMGSQVQIFVTPTAEKEEEETDVIAMNPMQQIQPMVIVIDTRDKNTLRGGLDKMFRLARGLVSVTPRMVRGTKVYEVRMGAGGLDATDPILSYAFIDNSICFATRPELMDGVIQGAAEPKDPLAKSADYKEGCKVLPDTLCSVQFKNSAANIEQTVKQLKGQGGAMAANPLMGPLSGLGELLDMDTLPSINTLKKYLTYTIGGTQPTGDGWFSVGYTPEP